MKVHTHKTKKICSYILMICSILCMLVVSLYLDTKSVDAATSNQTGCIAYGTVGVYFRKTPGGDQIKHNGTTIMLDGGHPLEILDTSNPDWYKVRLTYQSTTYTGYVASQYVYISSSPATSDAEFEKVLSGFPDSYKPQLRDLHNKHPKWIFKPVMTGLDWKTVIANEVNTGREVKNTVEGTSAYPRYNWRSTTIGYDWITDKYKAYDGSTWFAASDALVTYYLDPRIYLSEQGIFAFETLTYDSAQTTAGVDAILSGSFMYKTKPAGSTSTYAELMVSAGKASGISPYHIASRIRQEVGATNGSVTNGKHSKYPGIYNFYNIGAYDSAAGDAPTSALRWASSGTTYGRPWNSVYKSIYGGALYIGEKYIFRGQNTLYTQKFNVTNRSDGFYTHQYMTNVQAAESEAKNVYKAYSNAKMLDNPIVFSIPIYINMPNTISSPPADSGSPNNWLKTLTVSGYTLNFIPAATNYTLSVKSNVSSITIGATTVNSKAKVSGTGKVSLKPGSNTINIVVTAQNGNKRTYTLTVTRAVDYGPAAVKNLQTTPGNNSVTLSWDAVSGATGYRVYRYDETQKKWVKIAAVKTCRYTDTGRSAGATYKYAVRSYKTVNGTVYPSSTYPTKLGMANLNNVSGYNTTSTPTSVTISWNKVANADGYRVYRYNTTKKKWEKIATTNQSSYTDNGRQPMTGYKYTVRAYKVVSGTTYVSPSYSSFKTSTTPPAVNFKVAAGSKQATVSWDKIPGTTSYRVYYKTEGGKWQQLTTTQETNYTKTGLTTGKTYYFTVRAVKKYNGNKYLSPYTEKSITVK